MHFVCVCVLQSYFSRKFLSIAARVLWTVILLLWILSATEQVVSELKDCTRMALGGEGRGGEGRGGPMNTPHSSDRLTQNCTNDHSLNELGMLLALETLLLVVLFLCPSQSLISFTLSPSCILLHLLAPPLQLGTVQLPPFRRAGQRNR